MTDLKLYDEVRVRDWPSTRGERFTVIGIDLDRNQATLIDQNYATRFVPLDHCHLSRKAVSA